MLPALEQLSPDRAAKAAVLIARAKRAHAAERRLDEAVRRSLRRLLGPMIRAEIARANQEDQICRG